MRLHQRKLCQIITLLVSGMGASAAMAVTNVQGGGSSLVAPMIGLTGNPATELGLFGTAEGSFTYYPFGSGAGQNAFLNNQPTFFGAGVTGTVHFANSDAALTTAQLTAYKAGLGATSGPLIQIPYIVTPITVPVVNGPAVTSTTTPQTTPGQAHSIALNDNDLCGIFSGRITDWAGTGANHTDAVINPETGVPYTTARTPISVIYHSDGSGTTELLTRHLAAVCTMANTAQGVTFFDSMTFTASFPGGVVPANFVAASGDGGVRTQLVRLASIGTAAIAYLSPAYTNTFLAPSRPDGHLERLPEQRVRIQPRHRQRERLHGYRDGSLTANGPAPLVRFGAVLRSRVAARSAPVDVSSPEEEAGRQSHRRPATHSPFDSDLS
ncbi:substrate-binding domain-containing protein [Burkholderia ubonensis]|uniref:substrate-binding domain-containing protein n=1 Tax=Burkholderia ubonensis TaxID=101571 RepID=UPI0009B47158|nr:substrate-binding domain-containing protein [Burkholderia ubonensis]